MTPIENNYKNISRNIFLFFAGFYIVSIILSYLIFSDKLLISSPFYYLLVSLSLAALDTILYLVVAFLTSKFDKLRKIEYVILLVFETILLPIVFVQVFSLIPLFNEVYYYSDNTYFTAITIIGISLIFKYVMTIMIRRIDG